MFDVLPDFQAAMRAHGMEPPPEIIPGKLHRFPTSGKRNDDAGWCKVFSDGRGGVFGDHRSGLSESWQAKHERPFSLAERDAFFRQCREAKERAEAEEAKRHTEARSRASKIWQSAQPATAANAYLKRKGVQAHGARQQEARLVLSLRDSAGTLWSLQFIAPDDGEKRYLTGGRVAGCYFGIGKPDKVLCIAEGYATGASIHEATGHAVAIAFDAGNLEPVARALRAKYPEMELVLCADDDAATPGNPGISKATAAARSAAASLAIPDFGDNRPEGMSDFNDMAKHRGAEAVRACIARRMPVEAAGATETAASTSAPSLVAASAVEPDNWPELMPLVAETQSEPYPLDALPGVIGEAVREVVGFVQCPEALAACSSLSAASLVAQGLANVQRAEGLSGPSSLFLLAIAESGERKTTCDGHFLSAIREWEAGQQETGAPKLAEHSAAIKAWEARREGLLSKIKGLSSKDQPSEAEERDLRELEADKPIPPKVPRLLFGDVTPEALGWKLASGWPSAGVLSSEAGIVFGGHGMKSDSVMRNLALLNVLWDGGTQQVDRKQAESFILRGARLTMGLAVQPDTVRAFLEATKGQARGSGFAARFLIAWPESTQGARAFKEPPASWPHLSAFHRRIRDLLTMPLSLTEAGELSPAMLCLSPEAKAAWIAFHDSVEAELRPGGDMEQARDVASKAADNATRLAALFHIFEHGPTGCVSESHLRAGARIAAWHLYEARRFLGTLALPRAALNAGRLEAWLLKRCRASSLDFVSTRDVRQSGPGALRDSKAFDEAMGELTEAGRARLVIEGRRKLIHIRPELIAEARRGA